MIWKHGTPSNNPPKFIKNQHINPIRVKLCLFKWISYHCVIDIPHSNIASTVIQSIPPVEDVSATDSSQYTLFFFPSRARETNFKGLILF